MARAKQETCVYCGGPAEGNYTIHRDGFFVGPEVPLCDAHGGGETPTLQDIWERIAQAGEAAPRPNLDALMERVGLVADRADNFAHSVNLPLPPAMHVEQLAQAMREFCEELRAIYVAGTGENPWEL